MRVNSQNPGNIQNSELGTSRKTEQSGKTNSRATEKSEGASTVDTSGSANVEVSAKAREMSQASDIASNAPDIREAKIAELKRRIAAKEYNVKPEQIADKMVDEHIKTRQIN